MRMRLLFDEFVECHKNGWGVHSMAWTKDRKYMISACITEINVWTWPAMDRVHTFSMCSEEGKGQFFKNLTINQNGRIFFTTSNSKLYELYEFGERVWKMGEIDLGGIADTFLSTSMVSYRQSQDNYKTYLALNHFGEYSDDKSATDIFYITKGHGYRPYNSWNYGAYSMKIIDMIFSSNQILLVSFGPNKSEHYSNGTWMWDYKKDRILKILASCCRMSFSPNNRYLACVCPDELKILKKNWAGHKSIQFENSVLTKKLIFNREDNPVNIVFDNTGKYIVYSGYSQKANGVECNLNLVDWKKETILQNLSIDNITSLAFSPCGKYLLVGERRVGLAMFKITF